jgi:hypothetical protein
MLRLVQVADYHGVAITAGDFREGSRGESVGDDQGNLASQAGSAKPRCSS